MSTVCYLMAMPSPRCTYCRFNYSEAAWDKMWRPGIGPWATDPLAKRGVGRRAHEAPAWFDAPLLNRAD